jgi:hypothetical protein
MGTRGAYGVVIGETEKISYGQYDAYPQGKGLDNLRWLREVVEEDYLEQTRKLAQECRVVSDAKKPTKKDIEHLAPFTNLGVGEQEVTDWYCLTRETQGDIGAMLGCGYINDFHAFPLDSLFCEWAYIVDFDCNVFEVYEGFQKELPKAGRWAGRPTPEEDRQNYLDHLEWCADNKREPWQPKVSDYKAVELVGSWPLDALPSDEEFLDLDPPGELKEQWKWTEYGYEAAKLRNARARVLRKKGYVVKCSTQDFTDLAREKVSVLEATR